MGSVSVFFSSYEMTYILIRCSDNDIEGIIEPNFAVDDEKFGERRTIDLIPDGQNLPVDNDNKGQYVE